VRVVLLADEHERDLEAVMADELQRVLDDDADAAGELQVVDEEGDLHEPARRSFAIASSLPARGRPSRSSRSWM